MASSSPSSRRHATPHAAAAGASLLLDWKRVASLGMLGLFVLALVYSRAGSAPEETLHASRTHAHAHPPAHASLPTELHVFPPASAPLSASVAAELRAQVQLLPLQLWLTQSYCGGARPSSEQLARLSHGRAAAGRRVHVQLGSAYSDAQPTLLELVADARGLVHIPHLPAQLGTLQATGAPHRLEALPSHAQGLVYCLVDVEAIQAERELVDAHKQSELQADGGPRHLLIDYACMESKWSRCLHTLDLTAPAALPLTAPMQPYVPGQSRKQHGGAHAVATEGVHESAPEVLAVVTIHEPCKGRGECMQWKGPLPK